jgi:hypothetical protein
MTLAAPRMLREAHKATLAAIRTKYPSLLLCSYEMLVSVFVLTGVSYLAQVTNLTIKKCI